jgi:putative ABC transport system permease protein
MSTLTQDLRFALRSLFKKPTFTIVAVLSLALGIGANTAIFSVIDAVLLRPLPYAGPGQLVDLYESSQNVDYGSVSPANFRDWREQNHTFSRLAGYFSGTVNLQGVSDPERLSAEYASDNIFDLLGVRPMLGRAFLPGEDRDNASRVAVLSEEFWRRRFGADPNTIGKTITLSGDPYTIVGVMPARFRFPAIVTRDLWLPLQLHPEQYAQRGSHWLNVIGRLKAGVALPTAEAQLRQIAARLAAQYPDLQKGRSASMTPLRQDLTSNVRPALLVLLGAAALVLLIACANVANLLLARASDRRREVAIRLALGAGRGRLIRQFLTESLLLSLAGALVGLLLAYAGAGALLKLGGSAIPFGADVGFDPTVFAFLLIVAVGTGVVFGLAPALQATQVDLQGDLKEGGGKGSAGRDRQRFRNLLVVGETALALVLLVSAGLVMRAFLKLQNTDTGMVTHNVLTMHLSVPQTYDSTVSTHFYQPALQRIEAIPGVRAVGLISLLPLQESYSNGTVGIVGRKPDKPGNEPFAESRRVSAGLFPALGIRIIRGRNFTQQDRDGTEPVVIVNHAFASKYFPNSDAIGQRIMVSDSASAPIVGVVADVRESRIDWPSAPTLYYSFLQAPRNDMTLVISTTVDPTSITNAVRAAIHSVDRNQPVYNVKTMNDVVAASVSNTRFSFWLLGTFAAIALALAAVGIYGVMSYVVTQRTREIGIRMALGARHSAVTQLIVRHGMSLAIGGLAIGTIIALALTRVLASMLYGASATDPATFAGVALLLGVVALVASYVPARRAAAVDPVIALRSE